VCWCKDCTYGRVIGQRSAADVAAFYEIPYYTHGNEVEVARSPLVQRVLMHLAWRRDRGIELSTSEGVGRSLLDVGCGSGDYLNMFARAGFDVVGVDPDPKARSVAQKFGPVHDGTAEDLPSLGRQFDTVLFSHVLEHCIDPATALRNARSVIAPGGRLIVEVPNNDAAAFGMFQQLWPWTDIPRHLHFFAEASMRKLMADAGFRATKVLHHGYTRQFHPHWIRTQQQIWRGTRGNAGMPQFGWQAWRLLAKTWNASPAQKYDSIRVHADPI
jgi:SAM-dependent methyltransferase